MQDRRIVPANQRVEVVNSSNNNVENNFEDKLQKVLNLYKEEKASVQNLQQSIANKRKQLQLLQDTTENMERNIFHKEEILYSIRLVRDILYSRYSGPLFTVNILELHKNQ